jgi:hypothetical protein
VTGELRERWGRRVLGNVSREEAAELDPMSYGPIRGATGRPARYWQRGVAQVPYLLGEREAGLGGNDIAPWPSTRARCRSRAATVLSLKTPSSSHRTLNANWYAAVPYSPSASDQTPSPNQTRTTAANPMRAQRGVTVVEA